MYVRLPDHVIFKSRYGEWYFIDTRQRDRDRFRIETDTVELVLSLLRGEAVNDVAQQFGVAGDDLVSFVELLRSDGLVEITDYPASSTDRCFALSPPLDSINLLITNACNLRCAHCYVESGKRVEGELTGKEWIDLLEQARRLGAFELNVSGGEPLLHRDFWEIAEYIASVPAFNANLNTNGTLIKEGHERRLASAFTSIQISIDDAMPDSHDAFRGHRGCFEKAVAAIQRLAEFGVETNVGLTLTQGNIGSLEGVVDLCERIGVTVLNIGLVANVGRANANALLQISAPGSPTVDGFMREVYRKLRNLCSHQGKLKLLLPFRVGDNATRRTVGKQYICSGDTVQIVYVMANGTVTPCDKLPMGPFGYGNIRRQSLMDVWMSERMRAFKLMSPRQLPKCRDCPYLAICGGACVARAFQNGGTLESPDWTSCMIAQQFAAERGLTVTSSATAQT